MKQEDNLEEFLKNENRNVALPMTQEEVKNHLESKQDQDEARAIAWLAETPEEMSVAGKIYMYWGLNRQIIKECHNEMNGDRGLQVTFNNLIGATRFKTFEGGRLMRARCPNKHCGQVDSWEHFKRCYGTTSMAGKKTEDKVKYLVELSKRIRTENPIRPSPTVVPYRGKGGEITEILP